jgi:hypothetical protein
MRDDKRNLDVFMHEQSEYITKNCPRCGHRSMIYYPTPKPARMTPEGHTIVPSEVNCGRKECGFAANVWWHGMNSGYHLHLRTVKVEVTS